MLYFDHNATSPLCHAARQAWLDATDRYIGNASSLHRVGRRADRALEEARERLASLIGCEPCQIVWTSGASESNNTAIAHLAQTEGEAWISAIEHPCVLEPVRYWFRDRHRLIPVTRDGVVDLDWVADRLRTQRPRFVAVMAANNETGVLQPWKALQELCERYDVPFLCDAVQWIGKMPSSELGRSAFVTGCAHKFGGPPGVGFLRCDSLLQPLVQGGPQEDRRRAGTENLPGVLAMVAALEERCAQIKQGQIRERQAWREDFERELIGRLPDVEILGTYSERLWNTAAVLLPEIDCRQRWAVKLDKLGYAVSTGSACASGKEHASHVLEAMGYSSDEAGRVVRVSSGWETAAGDWQALLAGIEQASHELRARAPAAGKG